jgi:flagellar basal body P-ring protein FlgI
MSQRVAFMSMVENLDVVPGEPPARVVVNSRTGTVVISRNVRVTASAVAHGTISVAIAATNEVSQPNPLSQGQRPRCKTPSRRDRTQEPDVPCSSPVWTCAKWWTRSTKSGPRHLP